MQPGTSRDVTEGGDIMSFGAGGAASRAMRLRRTRRAIASTVLAAPLLASIIHSAPVKAAPPTPLVHDYNMGNLATNERELSMAVDPNNANRLMAGSNQRGGGQSWFASNDGGRTFTNGAL